jgi:AraC-like DNA-binding protein
LSTFCGCSIFANGCGEIIVRKLAASTRPSTNATDPPDCELLTAGDVVVGRFRCVPEDARFPHAGAITRHCFVFPRRGVWIQHEGREAFVADPTRVTLYNPRQAYERRALDPQGDQSDWITVSDAIAREVVGAFDPAAADSPARIFQHPYAPAGADLYLAQRRLHQYVRRNRQPDQLLVEESAIDIFARTISGLYAPLGAPEKSPPLTRHHRDTVEQVCAYLNQTLTTNLSLTHVARAVGSSVFHLCRIFRRGTGLTMHAYRHHLRLRRALEALEQPDMDLLTLALDLGYSGHSHFTAAFHRLFGLAPSKLRDDMKAVETPPGPWKRAASNPSPPRTRE